MELNIKHKAIGFLEKKQKRKSSGSGAKQKTTNHKKIDKVDIRNI